jgi:hypothetical protein
MSLKINTLELLTNFLSYTEREIDMHKTKMSDYIAKHHKKNHPEYGTTILGYNSGYHSQFELVIDNDDSELRVMTQRSFLPDIKEEFLRLKDLEDNSKAILNNNCFEIYVSELKSRVRFTLKALDNGKEFVQTDVWL